MLEFKISKIQFLKEAAKFVRDLKSIAKEPDVSLAKHKALINEIKCHERAVVSQDVMLIVQNNSVVDTPDLQTELERDLKGKSSNTQCALNTLDPLSRKLDDENVSLEYQVLNYAKENEHLKTIYKNFFDSIKVTQAQTKLITDSLQEKLNDTIYENATLRAQLHTKFSEHHNAVNGTSVNTKFTKQSILEKPPSSSKSKLYSVTSFPNSKVIPKYLDELKRLSNLEYRDGIKIAELTKNFNGISTEIRKKEKLLQLEQWDYLSTHPLKRFNSFCYDDDDEDYTIAVTPSLSIEEPDNSLSMGDEHLDTIPATESDKFIKSSVENLIPIPSESEGIPEHMCDVPFNDNSSPLDVSKDQIKDFSESNDEFSSPDYDSFSIDKIDYVEASPPDFELVSSEVMEIVIPEVGGIDDDILLTIKDDILCEKLLNVNLLIAKIEALNDNPTPSSDFKT
nr:hypothetical protein [Tanacetum cinerariifolium]